jgi:hypothetical protein
MKRLLLLLAVLALSAQALAAGTFTNEVLVLNSAATRVDTGLSGRRGIEVLNLGPNAIFCGVVNAAADATAVVVVNKARKLNAGESWGLSLAPERRVYCIAATADQVTTAATIVTEVD